MGRCVFDVGMPGRWEFLPCLLLFATFFWADRVTPRLGPGYFLQFFFFHGGFLFWASWWLSSCCFPPRLFVWRDPIFIFNHLHIIFWTPIYFLFRNGMLFFREVKLSLFSKHTRPSFGHCLGNELFFLLKKSTCLHKHSDRVQCEEGGQVRGGGCPPRHSHHCTGGRSDPPLIYLYIEPCTAHLSMYRT